MERREFVKHVALGSLGLGLSGAAVLGASSGRPALGRTINVLVWDEQQDVQVKSGAYKNYLGNAVAEFLAKTDGLKVVSANMNEPDQGLSDDRIAAADVVVWWGH